VLRIAAFVAAALGLFLGVMYVRFSGDERTGDERSTEGLVPVVVAAKDIAAGTEISEEMVKVVEVPDESVVVGGYSKALLVIGEVTNVAIAAGEQVSGSKVGALENPAADSRPPPLMLPEKRAMSVNIEPVASGERVRPGDRVDILAANDDAGTAMTLVQNVEVLAIARSSARPPSQEIRETVTVAVDADQVRVLEEWREKASELLLAFRAVPD
jgi:pilus assembly protein CpaB